MVSCTLPDVMCTEKSVTVMVGSSSEEGETVPGRDRARLMLWVRWSAGRNANTEHHINHQRLTAMPTVNGDNDDAICRRSTPHIYYRVVRVTCSFRA